MHVVRPPSGFRVIVEEHVKDYIHCESTQNVRVEQFWKDILQRIKFTALREGEPVSGCSPPRFVFLAEGAPRFELPHVRLVYEIFADTLTVKAALVSFED